MPTEVMNFFMILFVLIGAGATAGYYLENFINRFFGK